MRSAMPPDRSDLLFSKPDSAACDARSVGGGCGDRLAFRFNDLRRYEIAGVWRVLHGRGFD
jgi:hypothetical protein